MLLLGSEMAGAAGRESWYTKCEILNKRQSFYNYTEISIEKTYWSVFLENDANIIPEITNINGYMCCFRVW